MPRWASSPGKCGGLGGRDSAHGAGRATSAEAAAQQRQHARAEELDEARLVGTRVRGTPGGRTRVPRRGGSARPSHAGRSRRSSARRCARWAAHRPPLHLRGDPRLHLRSSGVSARAPQKCVSRARVPRSVSNDTFISIACRVAPAVLRLDALQPCGTVRQQRRDRAHPILAAGADEALRGLSRLASPERAGRCDDTGHAAAGPIVDGRERGAVVASLEADPLLRPELLDQAHRFA